jgi:glutaredoxin
LTEKQIVFVEHQIGTNVTRDEVLTKFPNAKMVPIIILNGTQIGGFNDLQLLMENTG